MESDVEDFDSITLDIEDESVFLSQNDRYFYIQNKSQIYEVNEYGVLTTYSLPEPCQYVYRKGLQLYFSGRNKLYKLLDDSKFGEKKFRQRLLAFLPLDSEYPLLVMICKNTKTLQLQINDRTITLEKYSEKCDANILYLDLLFQNLVLCVYKTGCVIKYCLIGIDGVQMVLLRKQILTEDVNVKLERSIFNDYFALIFDDSFKVLTLDTIHYSFDKCVENKIRNQPYEFLKFVNGYVMFLIRLCDSKVFIEFRDVYSESCFKILKINLNFKPLRVVSFVYSSGMLNILLQSEDSKFTLVSFSYELPTESISYYDYYESFPPPEELERLIESSDVIITSKLVDHIIANGLKSCSKKIIKCIHLPEIEAVKLIRNDVSLLEDFVRYTRGSDSLFKEAFRKEIDSNTFKVITNKLLESITNNESDDREYVGKVINIMNILLDAKTMELKVFDKEIITKLKSVVEGCQKEHLDLQSLLSFTNTLLDNKINYNTNPLMTSIDISLE